MGNMKQVNNTAKDGFLWICGKYRGDVKGIVAWEFFGIFDNEQDAIEVCTTDRHFVAPTKLNEKFPDEVITWPGAYYPQNI